MTSDCVYCKACEHPIHVTKIDTHPCEYLRRNLLVSRTYGIKVAAENALERLDNMKNPPKWMVRAMDGIHERILGIPAELAAYRNQERSTDK